MPNASVNVDRNPRFYGAAKGSLARVSALPGEEIDGARKHVPDPLHGVRGSGTALVVFTTSRNFLL